MHSRKLNYFAFAYRFSFEEGGLAMRACDDVKT
jgi:hypothetical protein